MPSAHSSPDGDELDRRVDVPSHVVLREFPNETVVLNLETGKYFSLNPTAGRMAQALKDADSLRAAAAKLDEDFGEEDPERIRHDLLAFCLQLEAKGLVEISAPE